MVKGSTGTRSLLEKTFHPAIIGRMVEGPLSFYETPSLPL